MGKFKEKIKKLGCYICSGNVNLSIDNIPVLHYNKFVSGALKLSKKPIFKENQNGMAFLAKPFKAMMAGITPASRDISDNYTKIILSESVPEAMKYAVLRIDDRRFRYNRDTYTALIVLGFGFSLAAMAIIFSGYDRLDRLYCNKIKALQILEGDYYENANCES